MNVDFSDFPCFVPTEDPEWLHLLSYDQRAWRDAQFAKGVNPDSFIRTELINAGLWPPREEA